MCLGRRRIWPNNVNHDIFITCVLIYDMYTSTTVMGISRQQSIKYQLIDKEEGSAVSPSVSTNSFSSKDALSNLCLLLLNRSRTRRTEVHKHNHSKKYNFHNISISQHLQKKLNKKTFTKKELQRHQPKRAHQPNAKMATQENNEYLVQQQNRVQYRTMSKYKTHDKMERTRLVKKNIKQRENVSKVTFECTARKHTVSTMYAASTIHASM